MVKDNIRTNFLITGTGELTLSDKGNSLYDYLGRRKAEFDNPNPNYPYAMWFDCNHKNEHTFRSGSFLERQFAYHEESHLIGEYDIAGNPLVEYIWIADRPIAAILPNNRVIYLITDWQNKPRVGIDAVTKQVVWRWDPDAFGIKQPTGSITLNLRFPGQYYDEQSKLYYNHNRYYNPELGRYMEPDPELA